MGRQAVTELELDAVAADVLNHNDLSEGGMNPGLKVLHFLVLDFVCFPLVLWEEERERRARLGLDESLEAPSSPTRYILHVFPIKVHLPPGHVKPTKLASQSCSGRTDWSKLLKGGRKLRG